MTTAWNFDSDRFDRDDGEEIEIGKIDILQSRRRALLKAVSEASAAIAEIDKQLALLKSDQKQTAVGMKA